MLYQLIAYYLTDVAKGQSLWDYIGWTVIIFQNAAVLEVNKTKKKELFFFSSNSTIIHRS